MPIGHRSTSITAGVLTALLGGQLVLLAASDHQGQVRFGEVPVQGAAVHATQGETTRRVLTEADGKYLLPDLADGHWTIQVRSALRPASAPTTLFELRRDAAVALRTQT